MSTELERGRMAGAAAGLVAVVRALTDVLPGCREEALGSAIPCIPILGRACPRCKVVKAAADIIDGLGELVVAMRRGEA